MPALDLNDIMKALKISLISLTIVIVLIGCALLGGYFYVKNQYGIDLINTARELKILSEPVNETDLCPHAFSNEDMLDVQALVNQSVENFITYTEDQGYVVNFDNLPNEMMYVIRLSDKQVGAFAQTVIMQEIGGQVAVEDRHLDVALKQVRFSSITDNGALLNAIITLDLSSLKSQLKDFPYSLMKGAVPDVIYISSTVCVEKGTTAFSYSVSHHSLTINNLNTEESADLFNTLDIILEIGSAESWNVALGSAIADALIGNENNNGLAYSLKDLGATDYAFAETDGIAYFLVMR